jgi:hypothetical protein
LAQHKWICTEAEIRWLQGKRYWALDGGNADKAGWISGRKNKLLDAHSIEIHFHLTERIHDLNRALAIDGDG